MFSKTSRYRKLPDDLTNDAEGRNIASKSLRSLPETTGSFTHVIEEGDRLDHLAYKYYRQPQKWWRICDANPEFMSPQSLLGKEPLVKTMFPVNFYGAGNPPWHALYKNLMARPGIEDVSILEESSLVQEAVDHDGSTVNVMTGYFDYTVVVIYNQMNVKREDITGVMETAGFNLEDPVDTGRVGQNIIIPPNTVS